MAIFSTSVKAWFGLADDHLHFEAQINSSRSFYEYFNFYFQLQPWGQTPRFNPSQLIGWAIESTIFGVNPLGWRVTQLFAVVICGVAIGIAIRNFCNHFNLTSKKSHLYPLFGQAIFLALPFWSETIGRIGAPETFGAVAITLVLINISRILDNPDSMMNYVFLAINTVLLVGFKENLLMFGFFCVLIQVYWLHKNEYFNRVKHLFLIVLQLIVMSFLVFGFLPELISSGQQVNGAGIGFDRLILGKWLIVPSLSIGILVFSYLFSWPKNRPQLLKINLCLTLMVFCEYFIMAGRLGGHYGFLSGVLISIQTMLSIVSLKMFKKVSVALVSLLTISGLVFNLTTTNTYFQRTIEFKQELLELEKIQQSKDLRTVVIVASSEEQYEAVRSIVIFNLKPEMKYFLLVTDDFPDGQLRNNLIKISVDGNLDWHILPIDEWAGDSNCVEIRFSSQQELDQCNDEIRISWLDA
jgi:hypothetical protein